MRHIDLRSEGPQVLAETLASGPGRPLPGGLRDRAASVLEMDLATLTVRECAALREWGIEACAVGDRLFFQPGRLGASREGLRLLGHELAHVQQQREGRVGGAGLSVVIDDALEAEADEIGNALADLAPRPRGRRAPAAGPRVPVLQPKVTVADVIYGYNNDKYQPFDDLWSEVQLTGTFIAARLDDAAKAKVKARLKEWAMAARNPSFLNPKKRVSQNKIFDDFDEVAKAAIGDTQSDAAKKYEAKMAKDVYASGYIKREIKNLIGKVNTWHGKQRGKYLGLDEPVDCDREVGRYAHYYSPLIGSNRSINSAFRDLTANNRDISNMAAFLADYSLVCRDVYPEDNDYYYQNDEVMEGRAQGNRKWNVNEGAKWTVKARNWGIPLGAGPSATTLNVLALSKAVDAMLTEVEAIAWGLFAFWNQTFNRQRSEIHTFHEVMVIAQQYGVAYTPNRYPTAIPPYTKDKPREVFLTVM